MLNLKLSAGGYSTKTLARTLRRYVYEGSFETNGDAAAVNLAGHGFSVAFLGTGQYRVTLPRSHKTMVGVLLTLEQASSGAAAVILVSKTPGDADTAASFVVETHSALGTEANLDGPKVHFQAICSDELSDTLSSTDET